MKHALGSHTPRGVWHPCPSTLKGYSNDKILFEIIVGIEVNYQNIVDQYPLRLAKNKNAPIQFLIKQKYFDKFEK
jgi:hypothetical protein